MQLTIADFIGKYSAFIPNRQTFLELFPEMFGRL